MKLLYVTVTMFAAMTLGYLGYATPEEAAIPLTRVKWRRSISFINSSEEDTIGIDAKTDEISTGGQSYSDITELLLPLKVVPRLNTGGQSYRRITELKSRRNGNRNPALSVAWQPNGQEIALGRRDGTVTFLDPVKGSVSRILNCKLDGGVTGLCYSPDCQLLACWSGRKISLWRTKSDQLIRVLSHPTRSIVDLCFATNNQEIIVSSSTYPETGRNTDDQVQLLPLENNREEQWPKATILIDRTPTPIWHLTLSADGKVLAASDWFGQIQRWDLPLRKSLSALGNKGSSSLSLLAFRKSSDQLISLSNNGVACVWNAKTGLIRRTLQVHASNDNLIDRSDVSHNGLLMYVAGSDALSVWNVQSGRMIQKINLAPTPHYVMYAISPDQATLVAVGQDAVYLANLPSPTRK